MVDYFARAAALYRTLDTHRALARARIVPSATARYALADVRAALERFSGGRGVVLRCAGRARDVLREVRYVYLLRGSLQTGVFVPTQDLDLGREAGGDDDGGECQEQVRYLPKRRRGEL